MKYNIYFPKLGQSAPYLITASEFTAEIDSKALIKVEYLLLASTIISNNDKEISNFTSPIKKLANL